MNLNKMSYLSKQYYVLFIIGLLAKLFTIFNFSPTIVQELFAPFVNQFLANPLQNPYEYFYQQNFLNIFPYGFPMLLSISGLQGMWYILTKDLSSIIPIMLSLLSFDIAIYIILMKKLPKYIFWILVGYWLSPLVYYITYIHGQLDVIPTLFLLLGIYFLDYRLGLVSLFLGISVAIKNNNLLIIPFFLVYLYKNHTSVFNYAKYLVYLSFPYFLFNGYFLFSEGFQQVVLFNEVQNQLLNFSIDFNQNIRIYILPILYGLLLARFFSFIHLIKDLFILFSTIVFGTIIIFLPPQPGWYFWLIPLLLYSVVRYDIRLVLPYTIWSILIPIYFIMPNNILYTVIIFIQIMILLIIHFKIINQYLGSKILYQPYFIGIAGDSGTGKSQLAQNISNFFGEKSSIIFCGDDLHKWERGHAQWEELTHLNPVAQNLYNNIKDFVRLKQGKKITRTHYDHNTGKFVNIDNIQSKNIVIHEGLHTLYLPQERKFYDLKIFIDPQKELYHQWKINRDTVNRGYSIEKVMDNIKKRLLDKEKYIDSQSRYADMIISYYISKNSIDNIAVKIVTNMTVDLDPIIAKLSRIVSISVNIEEFMQTLDIRLPNSILASQWFNILEELCPHMDGYPFNMSFDKDNYEGLILLFILYNIFSKEDIKIL